MPITDLLGIFTLILAFTIFTFVTYDQKSKKK